MPVEQVRSQTRHQRILDSAASVFSQRGYRDASVDDIASASDTSKGGVYFHFPTKEAIFLAVLDRMAALLRERVEQSMAGIDGPVEQLDVALRTMLHTFASHRALARLFLIDALGANREFNARILSIQSEFSQIIASRLCLAVEQGAITDIDAGLTSEVWFGALLQVVTRWLLTESRGDLEAQYPALRSILRRSIGLAPEPARGLVS